MAELYPSVEQAIGRDRVRAALKRYENRPADAHESGIVRGVNADGSFEVLLPGAVQTTRCANYCRANVGDIVKVVIKANGKCDAIGRLGGEIGGGTEEPEDKDGYFDNATVDGTLHLTNTTDASGTADKDVALIIGNRDGNHMVFDTNEIVAKSSGSSEAMLWIGEQLGNVGIGGVKYGVNNVLWSSSGLYMNASQTATLSEAVSDQAHGIVLVFSSYSSGAGDNANFHSFFVPKAHVAAHPGKGSEFVMASSNAPGSFRFKYLYISDTYITGNADNSWDGTSGSGVKVTNSGAVLRYVYGV